jgi:hypothetical protein
VKGILVKLDRYPVTHAENVSMIFAVVTDFMFREQLRVDLVPPRLGVREHAVEIEDHRVKW